MIKVLGRFKTKYGVVAHLGERIHGMDEVEGSSPFSSTIRKSHENAIFFFSRIIHKSLADSQALRFPSDSGIVPYTHIDIYTICTLAGIHD